MNQDTITLRGVVIPVEWDENGTVIATAIATTDEDEYLIASDRKGQEFFSMLQKSVEVQGQCKTEGNKKVLLISDYKIIGRKAIH